MSVPDYSDGAPDGIEDSFEPTPSLVLIFTEEGIAEFVENGELVWTSDDDETYANDSLGVADKTEILNYLEAQEFLEPEEKALVEIESEVEPEVVPVTEFEPELYSIPETVHETLTKTDHKVSRD